MEQPLVIRFLILKSLGVSTTAAEFKSVYEAEALALSAVKNSRKHFAERENFAIQRPKV
jgi:hypothetical protein